MKLKFLLISTCLLVFSCSSKEKETNSTDIKEVEIEQEVIVPRNQVLTKEQQITSALFAAPQDARKEAMVYGYDKDNNFSVLKEGTNEFICIADNPKKDGFQVVAYHKSLEPYMARGRKLNSEGVGRKEKENIRSSEAASGVLKMPKNPATLHLYYGKDAYFNKETDSINNAKYRYVVYMPYATQKTTGLGLSPNKSGHPWLMFPGAYNSHIMITPVN